MDDIAEKFWEFTLLIYGQANKRAWKRVKIGGQLFCHITDKKIHIPNKDKNPQF